MLPRISGLVVIALGGLSALSNRASAAPPGPFAEGTNAAVFFMPNRVTPDPMDLNYPLLCVDANANGRDEIVSGGELDSIWRVMEWNPAQQSVNVVAGPRRPFPKADGSPGNQGKALVIDASAAPGSPKLYAKIINGYMDPIGLYDLRTRALEGIGLLQGIPVSTRDVNRDGVVELITFQSTSQARLAQVGIYDAGMTRAFGVYPIEVGVQSAIAVGNFDDDPQLEIATTAGLVYELTMSGVRADGTFAERMDGNWIDYIAAADVDADGRDEIIAAYWNRIAVIDHERGEVKWSATPSVNTSAQLQTLRAIDVLGTATPEIVVAQVGHPSAPGHFLIFDGVTGAELRTIQHPDIGVFGVNSCDIDGDGARELIAGLNRPVTGPDRLYIYDPITGQLKWRSVNDTGPVSAAIMADVDGDSREEVVFAPDGVVGVGDLKLYAYDSATLDSRWVTPTPLLTTPGTGRLNAMTSGDADGDGDVDLIVGSSQDGFAQLWAVDGRTRTLARSIQLRANADVRAVAMADVTGDGHAEIVAAMSDGVLDVRDRLSGGSLWTASWAPTAARELRAIDLNLDGAEDLVVRTAPYIPGQAEIFVVDGSSHAVREIGRSCVTSIVLLDVLGSRHPEIVSGTCEGAVQVIDASNGAVLQSHMVCSGSISALARNRLSSAGPGELLFVCGERIGWISLVTGETLMMTAVVGDQLASGGGLFSTGSSAATDRIVVTSTFGVTQLRPAASLPAYVEPFNPTTTNIYSTQSGSLTETMRFGTFGGDTATLEVVSQPQHGVLTITDPRTGEFRYQSQAPFSGIDLLVVRARTPSGVSVPTAIPVQVAGSPTPPPSTPPPSTPPPSTPPPSTPPPSTPRPQPPSGGGGGGGALDPLMVVLLCVVLVFLHVRPVRSRTTA